jgi:plasmid stabilization system protein ParE
VAEGISAVELPANFLKRLEAIETFLTDTDAASAFDGLVAELRSTVIPTLARFPRIGRRYLDNPPRSSEALGLLAALPPGAASNLREYAHGDYLMLYTAAEASDIVHLLSIRHHRELSFDFAGLWPAGD